MWLRAQLPSGACDCHVHVVGLQAEYPMVAQRHYTPGSAPIEALRAHMAACGLERAVIVQPSVYGFDNRCLLESLRQLGDAARGVAVVADDASDDELRVLAAQGVRGLRVNLESAGVRDPKAIGQALAYWAERVAFLDWHLQVYASLDVIAAATPHVRSLSVPVVLDHFAMAPLLTADGDVRLEAVRSLLRAGRAYVKLSAPYRLGHSEGDPNQAATRLASSYLQANPEQVLWGSDWPHTNREPGKTAHEVSAYRQIETPTLMQGIDTWLPSPALRERVLVENPARLYGWPV
jgi:predicted TIM-barrel fold metal-dependent hydrolase